MESAEFAASFVHRENILFRCSGGKVVSFTENEFPTFENTTRHNCLNRIAHLSRAYVEEELNRRTAVDLDIGSELSPEPTEIDWKPSIERRDIKFVSNGGEVSCSVSAEVDAVRSGTRKIGYQTLMVWKHELTVGVAGE